MVWVMALLPVPGARVAQVDVSYLKGRTEDVNGSIEHHAVAPAQCEHVVVVVALRPPCSEFVPPRFQVVGDEALELRVEQLDFGVGEERRHDDEAVFVEGCQFICRGAPTQTNLLDSVEANLDPHRRTLAQTVCREPTPRAPRQLAAIHQSCQSFRGRSGRCCGTRLR